MGRDVDSLVDGEACGAGGEMLVGGCRDGGGMGVGGGGV